MNNVVVDSCQNKYVGEHIMVQNLEVTVGETIRDMERILMSPLVILIAHDTINDKVVLTHEYRPGALMFSFACPQGHAESLEKTPEAALRILKETTGLEAKSIEHAHSLMERMDTTYAPVEVYYVTVDTRPLLNTNSENVVVKGAKELMKEVRWGKHKDLGMTLAANYIKANRKRT